MKGTYNKYIYDKYKDDNSEALDSNEICIHKNEE